jgi:hypothetical protein
MFLCVTLGAAALLAVACGGAPAAATAVSTSAAGSAATPTAAPATSAPATSAPATVAATATATATAAASVAPTVGPPSAAAGPDVNLTFTGTIAITAVGSAGHCGLIKDATGKVVSFGFEASEADYAGLGTSFSLAELSPGYVDVKWVVDGANGYARPGPAGGGSDSDLVLSSDGHTLTLDVQLQPFGSSGPEHVAGTITCP